jgi:peptidoglycan-N-acetylmuramic acid deacetylase PdaC-like protein
MRVPIVTLMALASASAGWTPHKVVRNTALLDFSYQWPAEAAAIPALDLQLYKEAKAKLAKAQNDALDDQTAARQQKREFHQHEFSMSWTMAGQTARLLSLQSLLGTFSGGAHPNTIYGALLWDRRANRQVNVGALFLQPDAFSALTRIRYCAALNAERHKRRQGEDFGGSFDQCPKFSDLAIAPADKNKDGRFDTIEFVASPYVAGPYVEGEYETSLPVTSQLINAIRPEYRNSFARHRQ